MADEVPHALNYIPEVILKKRKNNEEWAIRRKLQLEQKVRKLKSDSFVIKKPEQFIREYKDKEMDLVQMKQRGKKAKRALISPDFKLLFVIRIGGKSDMHPRTRKLLYSLRLRKIFSGVFLKANGRIMEILQKVEPYVTYGYPNLKSVKDLLYKKGSGKIDNQRVPLTSNDIVEQTLSQHGIICLEDIVREVASVGAHFKEVTSFLCPFSLTKPDKALLGKKRRYNDGGDSGNREDHINELISKMN
ncbi:large ribosomal subunit protein uL30y-like [Lycium ferocissimum]|uniref:large ribosomal subunit protein uL30y-like n=1 Tax=Lycium ferocissimum TaxID=112874 RepID=UPI002815D629|nr:large ribosomal subunit protein uL30y-like [Lycium ferocissimum]XP_059299709.1 large ribosomal subunit protein uL30y-like [Lycium ferocissimum]